MAKLFATEAALENATEALRIHGAYGYSKEMDVERYYRDGPPADWQERFVSAYATAHPWEDFAETWAHYLHILDTVETANAFGLRLRPRIEGVRELAATIDFDPYQCGDLEPLIEAWLPLTFAVNSRPSVSFTTTSSAPLTT